MISDTDEELVREVQEGDILAFESLVKRYQSSLIRFVTRILNSEPDAEEVVQDTFLNVYKTVDRVDPKRKFSSYLYAVGRNLAITRLRAKKKESQLNDEILVNAHDEHYDRIIKEEGKNQLLKAISTLGEKYQKIVKLYYFGDLSYKEIAEELSTPVNTVRTHLRRAKIKLRGILKDEKF